MYTEELYRLERDLKLFHHHSRDYRVNEEGRIVGMKRRHIKSKAALRLLGSLASLVKF
ncbi:hypothetical protein [Paenibacillus fonticola]|uniref:hypothetical protein n=1 Tax=Paenibacillus fonticola TaxID=379896 RepID=UPI000365F537|nr:hypothetical protein [Paenibacillus fonticola]